MPTVAPPSSPIEAYDARTIFLHWLTATMVLGLWILGQCIDYFPRGDPRVMARSAHITCGLVLGVVVAVRLAWRYRGGLRLPPAEAGVLGRTAIGVHRLLYLLLTAIVVIGIACVWVRGDTLFNVITITPFNPANKALRHNVVELHGLIANVLLSVAGLHAVAAIWHHCVRRDGVLKRMWPRR